jgi:ribonuclease Z
MNAKNILLTHFSARYPKMPPSVIAPLEENTAERKDPLVTLAFDLVELDLDKMWKMNLYLPAIEKCFKDSAEEGDDDLHAMIPESLID